MPLPFLRRAPRAVLYIGPFSVEWLERDGAGEPRHARIDLASPAPELLVRAVDEARRAAGARERGFVLAVSHPLSFHKLINLPPLGRKDLSQVFRRRAKAMAGEDARHVFYVAREMGRGVQEDRAAESCSWLLAGVRAGARDLGLLLRDQGLHVRRVVSAELAALEFGRQRAPAADQATIVVVVGEGAVSVALTSGAQLFYQESIEGDLSARPALATGLIHEIKTCAAFWKKRSRGQSVGQVVVVGLPKARVELLALTLASILPGASVTAVGGEADDPTGRRSLLEAAFTSGPLDPELTFWLPQRRRQVALGAALATTAALAATFFTFDAARRRVQDVREEVGALRRGTADLEDLRGLDEQADGEIARIERYMERRLEIARWGCPAERILTSVLGAFSGRADFDELSLQPVEHERARVTIQGRCDSDPQALVARLRAVVTELERSSPLTDLELVLPEDFKDEGTQGAAFTIRARARS